MATTHIFAYNTGSTIDGTIQVGNLAVGIPTSGFTGMNWWNGADEELGYVIGYELPEGNLAPDGRTAQVQFWRSRFLTEPSFIELTKTLTGQSFLTGDEASTYLTTNGYWNSWTITETYYLLTQAGDILTTQGGNILEYNY